MAGNGTGGALPDHDCRFPTTSRSTKFRNATRVTLVLRAPLQLRPAERRQNYMTPRQGYPFIAYVSIYPNIQMYLPAITLVYHMYVHETDMKTVRKRIDVIRELY